MRMTLSALIAGALALAGCAGGASSQPTCKPVQGPPWPSDPPSAGCYAGIDRTYDTSRVASSGEIAGLLPERIRARGKLLVGSSLGGAPAAFRAAEGSAPIGYEIDLATALGRALGVDTEIVPAAPDELVPGLGGRFDIVLSSVDITPERQRQANLFTYITVGATFGARSSKQHTFHTEDVCGLRVGVPDGTRYHGDATAMSARCVSDNRPALTVVPHTTGPGLIAALVRDEVDLTYAESTLTQYAVLLTRGGVTQLGPVRNASPQGVAVAKDDPELSEAIQRALQHLMDSEDWRIMATNWGVEGSVITKAELNPLR